MIPFNGCDLPACFLRIEFKKGKEERKIKTVPGEQILKGIFENFGLRYDKVKDGKRIAQQMKTEEIQSEIRSIIEKLK